MINLLNTFFAKIIKKKNVRTIALVKNIVLSFGFKGGSILIGLILIPMTISYINESQYGIWLTLSSIIGWFSFFDIGLGNGLRNIIAFHISKKDYEVCKTYITTSYVILILIMFIFSILFLMFERYFNWNKIFKVEGDMNLNIIIYWVFFSFALQFIFQLINNILFAIQKSAIISLLNFIVQFLVLVEVYILKVLTTPNLLYLVILLTLTSPLIFLVASILYFNSKLKFISPNLKYIDFRIVKVLLKTGWSFFIIQACAIIFFQTDNMVIARIFDMRAVTKFNVHLKLFSLVTMVFSIIIAPYWSAFSEAYVKNDDEWIKKNLYFLRKLRLYIFFITLLLLIFNKKLFSIWLGRDFIVDNYLCYGMAAYAVSFTWQISNSFFLNGIGKLKIQLIVVVLCAIINIPLAVILGNTFGLVGVVLSNVVVFLIMGTVYSIQVKKIISKKAKGIWNS
jgi:O-antigen/teichoic acid export membrane protein